MHQVATLACQSQRTDGTFDGSGIASQTSFLLFWWPGIHGVVESVHRCWVAYDRHGRERVLLFVRARASSGSPNCTFGPWRDGWSFEAKDQFINDVLDAYESVIGSPDVFRFL